MTASPVKILAIADDDFMVGHMEDMRPQVLLALGDLLDATIERAMDIYCPEITFGVRGNHDTNAPFPSRVIDLHCRTHTFENLTFGGFGGSWRYKPRGHHLYEQHEVETLLYEFPPVDVFIAHNSPAGIHERDTEVHQGFRSFTEYVHRCQPRWFLHGHQHVNSITPCGLTTVVGIYGEQVISL